MDENNKEIYIYEVSWKKRRNGVKPHPRTYTNKALKILDPHLLIDFYESKLTIKTNGMAEQSLKNS